MRFVSFVGLTEKGVMVPVGADDKVEPMMTLARQARETGLAMVAGEAMPIVAGCVFASDALLQGPFLEFRCLTPKQREAKAKAEAKAKK